MTIEVNAQYFPSSTPRSAQGNPLAEALSPLPMEQHALAKRLGLLPKLDLSSGLECQSTFFEISNLLTVHKPRVESQLLAFRIRSMLYRSYERQNPFSLETRKRLDTLDKAYVNIDSSYLTILSNGFQVDAMLLLAWSGMGKSTMIRLALSLLPQVIIHRSFEGQHWFQKQIVYLSIDAPVSASPKGLLLNICSAIDKALQLDEENSVLASISPTASVESLRVHVVKALSAHCVGLLHIDDMQRFGEGNKSMMLQAVALTISIANTCCCSLLFSGTPAALGVVQINMESIRRVLRRGSIRINAPTSIDDPFFNGLVKLLLNHQIVDKHLAATPEILELLLNMTAGVPGILNSIIVTALESSFISKKPLTPALLRDTFESQFSPIKPCIKLMNNLRKQPGHGWDEGVDKEVFRYLKELVMDRV